MEHLVSIAINVDDEDIKAKIEDRIAKEVSDRLVEKISSYMFAKYGGVNNATAQIIDTVVNKYKKEIIETAVKDVSLSIKRSPKYRTVLNKIEKIGTELEEYYGS